MSMLGVTRSSGIFRPVERWRTKKLRASKYSAFPACGKIDFSMMLRGTIHCGLMSMRIKRLVSKGVFVSKAPQPTRISNTSSPSTARNWNAGMFTITYLVCCDGLSSVRQRARSMLQRMRRRCCGLVSVCSISSYLLYNALCGRISCRNTAKLSCANLR